MNVVVGGKMCKFDLGAQVGEACSELLNRVLDAVKVLIGRASSDSVVELMQNIILTGWRQPSARTRHRAAANAGGGRL